MAKECLWYNGTEGNYELLDFDPNGLSNEQVKVKAWKILQEKYGFDHEDMSKAFETLYLLDVEDLKKVI